MMEFTAEQRGAVCDEGERGDQLPVNILLVSFQDIVAVDVEESRTRRDQNPRYRNACCAEG